MVITNLRVLAQSSLQTELRENVLLTGNFKFPLNMLQGETVPLGLQIKCAPILYFCLEGKKKCLIN